jgi:hypothetical protein
LEEALRQHDLFLQLAEMKTQITAALFAVSLWAAGQNAPPARTYPSGFSVVLDRGNDLSEGLPAKFANQLAPQPITLQPQDLPQIAPIASKTETKVLRQVSVSAGFVELVNRLAHAKAIDHIQPGYFDQYTQNLVRSASGDTAMQLPVMVDARYWQDDVLNDQAGYFNQMIGMMMAINLSHHYLGHFEKYAAKMAGPGNKLLPINNFLSPGEWEVSVRAGATDALNCALATEGARLLFETIDKFPRRPDWTVTILPRDTDVKKLNKQLAQYETQFFHGGLKFSRFDKFQFLPLWDQSTLISLAQEAFNGGPAFLAVIQGPMIHVHADELIRQFLAHVPGEGQGMGHRLRPMVETELNAVGQYPGDN